MQVLDLIRSHTFAQVLTIMPLCNYLDPSPRLGQVSCSRSGLHDSAFVHVPSSESSFNAFNRSRRVVSVI